MKTMNIVLSGEMKAFVAEQVKAGGYTSSSEFVRDLIRSYQKQLDIQLLEKKLLEGKQAPYTEISEINWEKIEAKASQGKTRNKTKKHGKN